MKITVCIGSSCHIKGSRQVVEQLQYLIRENNLDDKVELSGTFSIYEYTFLTTGGGAAARAAGAGASRACASRWTTSSSP